EALGAIGSGLAADRLDRERRVGRGHRLRPAACERERRPPVTGHANLVARSQGLKRSRRGPARILGPLDAHLAAPRTDLREDSHGIGAAGYGGPEGGQGGNKNSERAARSEGNAGRTSYQSHRAGPGLTAVVHRYLLPSPASNFGPTRSDGLQAARTPGAA